VAADAISRWLYPQLDPQLHLLDLSIEAQQHKDFLAGWIDLLSTTPSMMPFDKVGSTPAASSPASSPATCQLTCQWLTVRWLGEALLLRDTFLCGCQRGYRRN
jgi:hypothetical protein